MSRRLPLILKIGENRKDGSTDLGALVHQGQLAEDGLWSALSGGCSLDG